MWIAENWTDYEVLDCSQGEKLERWGDYILVRPDPQVIWNTRKTLSGWKNRNGHYHRSSKGGGEWEFFDLPEQWTIHYGTLTFNLKPFSFKHTGLFPEQAANWDWFSGLIKNSHRPVKVLNLFAYTGGATLAAAAAGAQVTHVDASKGMVAWAKENARSSGLENAPVRWLVDDCVKFVEREIRRGNKYDAIIMDPPSYGRGPKGEIWKIEDSIHSFIQLCTNILSDNPLFFLINSYTTGLAPAVLTYMIETEISKNFSGTTESGEIGLPVSSNGLVPALRRLWTLAGINAKITGMKEVNMAIFNVELKKVVDDSYEIEIGFELEDKLISDLKNGLVGNITRFAVITDSVVKDLYAEKILTKLTESGYNADLFVFEAGEKQKTRQTKEDVEDAMLAKEYRRDCCIIAIGGGVVTDLAGFVAGTFGRGVPFINYATTLLAAADASVGGKTAVDTPLATNLIGLFNQPRKVYIDIAAWKTLPARQISSGLAETVKHACIADEEFFRYLKEHMTEILNIEKDVCEHIAKENCKIKYNVVMKDERESGLREVLNLGHTVGRAIETVSDYRLLHGEAVSIGLAAEAKLAHKMGYTTAAQMNDVISLLKQADLPVTIPDYIDREALVKKLYTDKKVRNGRIRFVIQKGIGDIVEFENGVYAAPIEESVAREIISEL